MPSFMLLIYLKLSDLLARALLFFNIIERSSQYWLIIFLHSYNASAEKASDTYHCVQLSIYKAKGLAFYG